MKLTSVEFNDPVHMLVYGDPKVGKSTLVSKLAEPENGGFKLHWLSFDRGHSILKKLSPAGQDNIELFIVPDTRDYPVAVDVIRELWKMKAVDICHAHGKADCSVCKTSKGAASTLNLTALGPKDILVIDPLSQLSDSYMSLICKGKAIDYKLQLDDYGAHLFHMKKLLLDMQQANFNIICIAHAIEEETTDKQKKIMPAVGSSSFAPKVAGYFDHVVYCHSMNKSHRFGSATTYLNNVVAGSRTDVFIENMKSADGKIAAPNLLPFFDGTEKRVAQQGTNAAGKVELPVSNVSDAVIISETSKTSAAPVAPSPAAVELAKAVIDAAGDAESPAAKARRILDAAKAKRQAGG